MMRHITILMVTLLVLAATASSCSAQLSGTTVTVNSVTGSVSSVQVYPGYYVPAITASSTVTWEIDSGETASYYCTSSVRIINSSGQTIAQSVSSGNGPMHTAGQEATQTVTLTTFSPPSGTYTIRATGIVALEDQSWFRYEQKETQVVVP